MNEVLELANNKYLIARKMMRVLESPVFQRISNYLDMEEVKKYVEAQDPDGLKVLVNETVQGKDLGDLSLRDLRLIGKHLRIPHWSRLPQWMLIQDIKVAIKQVESMTGETVDIMERLKQWKKNNS